VPEKLPLGERGGRKECAQQSEKTTTTATKKTRNHVLNKNPFAQQKKKRRGQPTQGSPPKKGRKRTADWLEPPPGTGAVHRFSREEERQGHETFIGEEHGKTRKLPSQDEMVNLVGTHEGKKTLLE